MSAEATLKKKENYTRKFAKNPEILSLRFSGNPDSTIFYRFHCGSNRHSRTISSMYTCTQMIHKSLQISFVGTKCHSNTGNNEVRKNIIALCQERKAINKFCKLIMCLQFYFHDHLQMKHSSLVCPQKHLLE